MEFHENNSERESGFVGEDTTMKGRGNLTGEKRSEKFTDYLEVGNIEEMDGWYNYGEREETRRHGRYEE